MAVSLEFPYSQIIVRALEDGEPQPILRPELSLLVIGPDRHKRVWALVDTGADNTILPMSLARWCGIETRPGAGPTLEAFGGQKLPAQLGEVNFEVSDEQATLRWRATVPFFEFDAPEEESFVLGHAGFLNYFTATLDGLEGLLTLAPNIELPAC